MQARGLTWHGFSFASDESPPEKPRYCGLRFQITYVYILHYEPVATWELNIYDSQYPFRRERLMCDIVHAPGKTGPETLKVLEKQWLAKGLSRADCVNGVGDGGGENEGTQGVHSLMELANPGYVRRRCFGHLPWRVTDAGLNAMGQQHKSLQLLNTYLRDGTTWSRLKAIAVSPVAAGGLALVIDGSMEYKRLFSVSPPRVMEERPETAAMFLEWLLPKQETLTKLVKADLQTRCLTSQAAATALETLGSRTDCLSRHVDYVLVKKGLFLFYNCKAHPHIASMSSFEDLIGDAAANILSTRVDDEFLQIVKVADV
jgi:hypothetical protein